MADDSESNSPSQLLPILDLLESAGFVDARNPEVPASSKLAAGISWCIASVNSPVNESGVKSNGNVDEESKIEAIDRIKEDLRLIGCPFPLQDSKAGCIQAGEAFPIVQWLAECIRARHVDINYDEKEIDVQQLEDKHDNAENAIRILKCNLDELNQSKVSVMEELQDLKERINEDEADAKELLSLAKSLKDLEQQESEFQTICNAKRSELQAEITDLEEGLETGFDGSPSNSLDDSLTDAMEKLNLGKKELSTKLRAILALKRLLDDVPSQSELIQYERRFSELYVYIQGKLGETRKYYATYNALLEIKELMLKETSLLNSIGSQFQDAITSAAGRMKLVNSMEGIVKGIQQKLEKVELGFEQEQKICKAVKERYASAIAEQRQCYSLLKAFQEECAKNERLRSQVSHTDTVPIP